MHIAVRDRENAGRRVRDAFGPGVESPDDIVLRMRDGRAGTAGAGEGEAKPKGAVAEVRAPKAEAEAPAPAPAAAPPQSRIAKAPKKTSKDEPKDGSKAAQKSKMTKDKPALRAGGPKSRAKPAAVAQ
jgi:hypothetical protein